MQSVLEGQHGVQCDWRPRARGRGEEVRLERSWGGGPSRSLRRLQCSLSGVGAAGRF